jgi:xanthine dehydrogenase YagS FAD-binding subunit
MQHTRCAYFYDPVSACNRREPGEGCDAREGENRGHAILGWSDACIATHPSDFCVPLVALDAVVEIEGPDGTRSLPLEELHRLPGDSPEQETALAPGEIIVALRLPPEAAGFRAHTRYLKLRERTSFAFALVSAAAALDIAGGTVRRARLALGGVAAKPWRARAAEAVLEGAPAERAPFARAAEVALADARPSGDNAHKIELAKRVATRALLLAAAGTPERVPALPASVFAETGAALHA